MTKEELAEATNQFDEEFVFEKARPLTPEEREQWNRLKRKRGRPKNGKGFQRISLSIERGLLKRVSALARKRDMPRSQLVAQALEAVLLQANGKS